MSSQKNFFSLFKNSISAEERVASATPLTSCKGVDVPFLYFLTPKILNIVTIIADHKREKEDGKTFHPRGQFIYGIFFALRFLYCALVAPEITIASC